MDADTLCITPDCFGTGMCTIINILSIAILLELNLANSFMMIAKLLLKVVANMADALAPIFVPAK